MVKNLILPPQVAKKFSPLGRFCTPHSATYLCMYALVIMDLGKRKHEETEVEKVPDKRAKVEIRTNLLDLSDDVLLCIIRLLNSYELLTLSEVCTR